MDYNKLNVVLRIIMITILVILLIVIVKNKYGTPPPLADQELYRELGEGSEKIIDCRGALIYYFEHEVKSVSSSNADYLRNKYTDLWKNVNLTVVNIS